jgi:uncharacterized cupin superfamily protein
VRKVNLFGTFEGRLDVAQAVGSGTTAMFVYDVPPGKASSPYHYEYAEEWLLVVEGTIVLRAPDGEHALERGDLVHFPAGPDGAHKVMNRSDSPTRTLVFSRGRTPAVSVYPDSDKIAVRSGREPDELIFERGAAVPWSHGEEGWDRADPPPSGVADSIPS